MNRHFVLGYVLGLIVGEGSFTGGRQPELSMKLHEDDPEPLLCLKSVFGGRIYGPYLHAGRRYRIRLLRGWELWDALPVIFDALPPSKKRVQFEKWVQKFGLECHGPGRLFGATERLEPPIGDSLSG